MELKAARTLFVLGGIFVVVSHAGAQQKFIANASGGQAIAGGFVHAAYTCRRPDLPVNRTAR